jgi:uncharacterized Fe-S cluster-containing protein
MLNTQVASIPALPFEAQVVIELAIRRTTQELERRAHARDAKRLHNILDEARRVVNRAIPRECACRDKGCSIAR